MSALQKLTIQGFKSICNLEKFDITPLNILIGANGAGKSNFISFFKLLNRLIDGELQSYVSEEGGPDALLYYGRKKTPSISGTLLFDRNGYSFTLSPTKDNRLFFSEEKFIFFGDYFPENISVLGKGHYETLAEDGTYPRIANYVVPAVRGWRVYHFHDTSDNANVKQPHAINDNMRLRSDAGNLAAYLYSLKTTHPDNYKLIVNTIRLVAPFFSDFHLRPIADNSEKIQLEWFEKNSDFPFTAHHLSDGTLRFICLATLLLQPQMARTIIIDEPELGLHPYAITLLASLIKAASEKYYQIILSTQSVELINHFNAEDIIVVDHQHNQSIFNRLNRQTLIEWLEDYTLGELWKKNVFGGRPSR